MTIEPDEPLSSALQRILDEDGFIVVGSAAANAPTAGSVIPEGALLVGRKGLPMELTPGVLCVIAMASREDFERQALKISGEAPAPPPWPDTVYFKVTAE